MPRGPVVEPEHLLIGIARQVERLYRYIRPAQGPFQETPEVLDSVSVNLPPDVLFQMVHRIVNEILLFTPAIAAPTVRVDCRFLGYLARISSCNVSRFTLGMTRVRTLRVLRSSIPMTVALP